MATLNKCQFIGNLGRDCETRYMPNGDCVTNISIACTESYKDKNTGEKKEITEWIRVTFFRQLAEIAAKYLSKGSSVYIEGKMKTRKYTDKDGVEKYATEIIADAMQMLGSAPGKSDDAPQSRPPASQPPTAAKAAPNFSDLDDDTIPF